MTGPTRVAGQHRAGLAWRRLNVALARAEPACRGEDPELFFPTEVPSTGPHARLVEGYNRTRTRIALRMCTRCPVRIECFEFAMADPELVGVWGGTTDTQRLTHRPQTA